MKCLDLNNRINADVQILSDSYSTLSHIATASCCLEKGVRMIECARLLQELH